MDLTPLRKHPLYIIAAILLFFMGLALVLRMIPVFFIKDPGSSLFILTGMGYSPSPKG